MDPVAGLDVVSIRWMQYLYFAGGIAVILIGSIGTVLVILGILQAKFLKPYKNRYPFEEYHSFEEFAFKKPSMSENPVSQDAYPSTKEAKSKPDETPVLTWENAMDFIPNLTTKENKNIEEVLETECEASLKT